MAKTDSHTQAHTRLHKCVQNAHVHVRTQILKHWLTHLALLYTPRISLPPLSLCPSRSACLSQSVCPSSPSHTCTRILNWCVHVTATVPSRCPPPARNHRYQKEGTEALPSWLRPDSLRSEDTQRSVRPEKRSVLFQGERGGGRSGCHGATLTPIPHSIWDD